jgi:Uma2 family endonuclease
VVSKNDTAAYTKRKVEDYLRAGVRLLWVADPATRTVTVYAPGREPVFLGEGDMLTAGEIIPGFQVPVSEVFEE